MKEYDVVVVGAGPGGCTAATMCARGKLKVALLEKNPSFGQKLCAGGLIPEVLKEFEIEDDVIECRIKRHRVFTAKEKEITVPSNEVTVHRSKFDAYLALKAQENGVDIFTSTLSERIVRKNTRLIGVVAKKQGNVSTVFYGRIAIVSDGFNSGTARSIGLMPRYKPDEVALTLQREIYVKEQPDTESICLFFRNDVSLCGYGWIHPKRNCYSIGLGSLLSHAKGEQLVKNLNKLTSFAYAKQILPKETQEGPIRAACIPMVQNTRICAPNIMIIGDAAGQVDPMNGDGIYYAMKAGVLAGKVASEAITKEDFSEENLLSFQNNCCRLFGSRLRQRRKELDRIKNRFVSHMESQFSLKKHPVLWKTYWAINKMRNWTR
jgi:digeranylgeranylglycerophospholipid reductase